MDRRNVLAGLSGLAVAGVLPVTALAQGRQRAMDKMKMPALMGGDFATITSELALERGNHSAIRSFAELEIAEQAAVAAAFGAEPGSAGLSPKHAAMVEQLQQVEGAAFDAMYVEGQIAGHRELRDIHTNYARNGSDPMARGASMVGVAGIDTHLAMLRSIRAAIG